MKSSEPLVASGPEHCLKPLSAQEKESSMRFLRKAI